MHDRLLGLVAEALDRQDLTWSAIRPDQLPIENSEPVLMSLDNLRAWTAKEPAHEWPAVVADFVSNMLASVEAQREAPLDTSDVERIPGLLPVRLYPGSSVCGPVEPAARPAAEGVQMILVIDTPTTVMTVSREMAVDWPTSEADCAPGPGPTSARTACWRSPPTWSPAPAPVTGAPAVFGSVAPNTTFSRLISALVEARPKALRLIRGAGGNARARAEGS
jgi:hypothetical protein